jgi:aldose 1-epimerase
MAPCAGRLRDGRVAWRGRRWQMPLSEPPHALHGTVLASPWTVEARDRTSTALVTSLGPDWPFAGTIRRRLRLTPAALTDRVEIQADEEPFPAILGLHPWFRRRAVRRADGIECGPVEITIDAGRRVEVDAAGLPTGATATPRADPEDDVLLDVTRPPIVRWADGPTLELTASGAAAWIAYASHPDGVCVEPLTGIPDGLNGGLLGDPPIVAPGVPLALELRIRWR